MSSHSYKCIYNPAVVEGRRHRRRLEAADMLQRVAAEETEAARCIEVAEIQEQAEAKEQRQQNTEISQRLEKQKEQCHISGRLNKETRQPHKLLKVIKKKRAGLAEYVAGGSVYEVKSTPCVEKQEAKE